MANPTKPPKDGTIKEVAENHLQKEMKARQEKERAAFLTESAANREQEHRDRIAEGKKLSEDLDKKLTDILKTGQKGFDNFNSSVAAIQEMADDLGAVIERLSLINSALDVLSENITGPLKDSLVSRFKRFVNSKVDMPSLVQAASIDPDGKLQIKDVVPSLTNLSPDDSKKLNEAYRKGIEHYLSEAGYTKQADETFKDRHGTKLNSETFQAMQKDLKKELEKRFGMEVVDPPRP